MTLSGRRRLGLVFALALAVRVFHLDIPFVEPFNNLTRQAICAQVARNFYERGFKLFYPEVDENGSGPSLYNTEMPIYSYLMAIGYKLSGGVREGVARSVSVLFSLGALAMLYGLVRRIAGVNVALGALLFASLSPMSVALSRSIQPDITMVFGVVASLFFMKRYLESGRAAPFVLSAVSLAFAVTTKIHAMHALIPLVYLVWKQQGAQMLKDPKSYLYALAVGVALSWYGWMWWLGKQQPLAYDSFIYAIPMKSLGDYAALFGPSYLKLPAKAFFLHLLTPLGLPFFIYGLIGARSEEKYRIFYVWLGAAFFYLAVMWPTAVIHPYYLLSLLMPAAFFVGHGAVQAAGLRWARSPRMTIVWALLILIEAASLAYYYRLLYYVPSERRVILDAGRATDRLTPKDSLVLASWGASPVQLYYCDRRGWVFELDKPAVRLIEDLERRKKQGASHLVISTMPELHAVPEFESYLRARHKIIEETEGYVLIDLKGLP